MNKEISFIFHGPYSSQHIDMIEECRKYGEIILCTYKNQINNVSNNSSLYDKIILHDDFYEKNNKIHNSGNIFRHLYSVIQGLKIANGKHCIKIRSNHSFSNLEYIKNILINNTTDKFICDNFTINHSMPYHLSDSILAGTKETMIGIYETAINSLINEDFIYEMVDIRIRPELVTFCSYLKYKKIAIPNDHQVWFYDVDVDGKVYHFPMTADYVKFLDDNCQLIDIREIGPSKINFNGNNFNPEFTYKTIKDIYTPWYNK